MKLDISLAPQVLFDLGPLPVTNAMLWAFVINLFVISIVFLVRSNLTTIPGRLQNVVEVMLEQGFEFVKSVIGSEKKARKVFPLIFTMFIFVLISNMMSFIPGAALTIARESGDVPLFRVVTSDYAFVIMLTLVSVITMQAVAIYTHGPFGYLGKFFNFKGPLEFVLGLMDIIGELAKVLSLSFRLFGNMFAAEVLGTVMLALAPFIIPLPFMFLGLITAIIQAFVFSLLTLIFISMASKIEESESLENASI